MADRLTEFLPTSVRCAGRSVWQSLVMALDSIEIVRRLAYIRYLHRLGVEQARLPDPMSSAAVLMFHDAAESLLLMAGEHLGAPSIYEFEKYWDALKPGRLSGGVELPLQQGMKRLNRHRIALKHHGGHPSRETVELIKNDTATFLAAASQLIFGVDYDAVSTSSLIPQEAVRDLVLNAEAANGRGERVDAMIALVDAWEELFNVRLSSAAERTSPLRFGPSIGRTLTEREIAAYLYNENASRRRPRANEDIGRQIAGVTEVVMALQDAARLTAIGVDYAEYHRFLALTPDRNDYMTGRRTYRAPSTYAPSADDVTFCIQFVVNTALRLVAAETQLVGPPWIDSARAQRVPWQTIKEVPGRESQTGQT